MVTFTKNISKFVFLSIIKSLFQSLVNERLNQMLEDSIVFRWEILNLISAQNFFLIFIIFKMQEMKKVESQNLNHYPKKAVEDRWQESEEYFHDGSEELSFGQYLKKEKLRKRKQKVEYLKKVKTAGFWNVDQNKLYLQFLKKHKDSFMDQRTKRSTKIFRRMSNQIKTRSSLQCRSHHQKYEVNYPNIDILIEVLNRKLMNQIKAQQDQKQRKPTMDCENNVISHLKRAKVTIINEGNEAMMNRMNSPTIDEQTGSLGYRMKIVIISSWMEVYN